MSDERREVLSLLSEGRIDVDGAERLLEALEDGREKREPPRGAGSRAQKTVQEALSAVRDTVAGLGPMVGRIAGENAAGVGPLGNATGGTPRTASTTCP